MRTRRYPKWYLAAVSLVLGAGALAAFWVGGNARDGWISFAVIGGVGLLTLVGGRSDTVRGLRGDGRDEYWERLDLTATALAGLVLITAVIAMCFWEWAHGRDGSPYAQLGAITGISYIVILAVLRLRS
jgi:hypothetical protein